MMKKKTDVIKESDYYLLLELVKKHMSAFQVTVRDLEAAYNTVGKSMWAMRTELLMAIKTDTGYLIRSRLQDYLLDEAIDGSMFKVLETLRK